MRWALRPERAILTPIKGYIVENCETGLQFWAMTQTGPEWLECGYVYPSFWEAKGVIAELAEKGYRCITRKLTGIENDMEFSA